MRCRYKGMAGSVVATEGPATRVLPGGAVSSGDLLKRIWG